MFEFQRFLCYICMCLFTFLYNFKISGINKERNVRTWTKEEVEKFTQVLDKVRQQITPNIAENCQITKKKIFDKELVKKQFIEINENNNLIDKRKVIAYKKLATSIKNLRNKSRLLESEWCKLHSCMSHRSNIVLHPRNHFGLIIWLSFY